mmetsp:Transcript_20613/g.30717  ORF Transcript_20613/g.30717 Transcript_20613/m.30717 type:complete len:104 (+) Transcript_20613:10-321(+)
MCCCATQTKKLNTRSGGNNFVSRWQPNLCWKSHCQNRSACQLGFDPSRDGKAIIIQHALWTDRKKSRNNYISKVPRGGPHRADARATDHGGRRFGPGTASAAF